MPMQRIAREHSVVYHKYADDTQLYVTYNPNVLDDMQNAVNQLGYCIAEIRGWMTNRMVKLNDNKMELVVYISQYHLNKYGRCDILMTALSRQSKPRSPNRPGVNHGQTSDDSVQGLQLPSLQAVFYPPLYHNRCSEERSTGSRNI